MGWDKEVAAQLRQAGLSQDQIGLVIGIIAEHRMQADHDGYKRGFEDGYSYERGKMMFNTYKIKRFYADKNKPAVVRRTGLTLAEAKEHCSHSETASDTCTSRDNKKHTEENGPWFDGFEME